MYGFLLKKENNNYMNLYSVGLQQSSVKFPLNCYQSMTSRHVIDNTCRLESHVYSGEICLNFWSFSGLIKQSCVECQGLN